jgi:cell cycle sensor histidine kinase DivJ
MEKPIRHRLLERQLKKARSKDPGAALDLDLLLDFVSRAYTEQDNTVRLNDRAATLMSSELVELNEKLRRESELRARSSEAQLKTVLDNAAEAIISLDSNTTIVAPNRAAERIFGYRSADIVGKPISALFEEWTPQLAETQQQFIEWSIAENAPYVNEVRCRRQSGEVFPAELSFSRITIESDVLLISFWRDISERKVAQAELITAAEEAQAANLSKSTFLANMSHELRTPLNAIIGFTDLLIHEIHGPLGTPKYGEYIKDISESGAHLLQLVNDILDLSRIESGRYDLVLEPLSMSDVASSVTRQLSPLAQQGQLDFIDTVGTDLPFIIADRRALRQVLYNLLSNAIKFTPPGGRVSLSASRLSAGVEVVVEDTGIGMPKEALPRLGNPFEQVASSYARAHGGAGLGLAITKKLIGLQNGTMTFDSELGVGSIFKVYFPSANILAKTG